MATAKQLVESRHNLNGENKMSLKKREKKKRRKFCRHPKHNFLLCMFKSPGVYVHECPKCKRKALFINDLFKY